MSTKYEIAFNAQDAKKLFFGLILVEMCLVLLFFSDWKRGTFDLDGEANIPTWFSSIQLFLIGAVFLPMTRRQEAHHIFRPLLLSIVGAGFIFLSLDEAARIHETITRSLRHVEWIPRFKGDHGIWVAFYLTIGSGIALASWRDGLAMWRFSRSAALAMITGIGVYVLGGVGLEVISYQFLLDGTPQLYRAEVALEEFMEMAGASLVLYGALLLDLRLQGARVPFASRTGWSGDRKAEESRT